MIKFHSGPAKGKVLDLRHMPLYLRVVIDEQTFSTDALDRLDDTPRDDERIYVYRRRPGASMMHIKCSKRRDSGFYPVADYDVLDAQPPDDIVRNNDSWRAWAMAQHGGKIVRVEYEIPPLRAIYHLHFDELEGEPDASYVEACQAHKPNAQVRRVVRGLDDEVKTLTLGGGDR